MPAQYAGHGAPVQPELPCGSAGCPAHSALCSNLMPQMCNLMPCSLSEGCRDTDGALHAAEAGALPGAHAGAHQPGASHPGGHLPAQAVCLCREQGPDGGLRGMCRRNASPAFLLVWSVLHGPAPRAASPGCQRWQPAMPAGRSKKGLPLSFRPARPEHHPSQLAACRSSHLDQATT